MAHKALKAHTSTPQSNPATRPGAINPVDCALFWTCGIRGMCEHRRLLLVVGVYVLVGSRNDFFRCRRGDHIITGHFHVETAQSLG
jgi:hypothetical protein